MDDLGGQAAAPPATLPGALHEVVDGIAESSPDVVAVEDGTSSMTYSELSQHSRLVARALLLLGLTPSSARPLGTMMRRGPRWMGIYAGAMRCGVPIVALSGDLRDGAAESQRSGDALRTLALQLLVHEGAGALSGVADLLRQAARAGVPAVGAEGLAAGAAGAAGGPGGAAQLRGLPRVGGEALLAYSSLAAPRGPPRR
ncbi:unnamed protein product [Prorocentrum cordatum]|uniref:AMP-dependent synthetase/ligase domain-containing protein n=1 Tax=Prorocentrum cordatum TaxID=2364126 RepID=A0ABN9RLZ5_9DINO|nr:unnamed protein product [Polarella glacialis]